MWIINSNGPIKEPCGTPNETDWGLDVDPFTMQRFAFCHSTEALTNPRELLIKAEYDLKNYEEGVISTKLWQITPLRSAQFN